MFTKAGNSIVRPTALGILVQSSTYGQTIPRIMGRTKGPLLLIWANGIREGDSGKKFKGGKFGGPTYVENADFVLCSNPMYGVLRMWANQTQYNINLRQITQALPAGNIFTFTDSNYHSLLAVSVTAPYSVTFNDYGGQGPEDLTGTFEVPLWNAAFVGPNPINPSISRFAPYTFYHRAGEGPTFVLPYRDQLAALGVTAVTAYYSQIVNGKLAPVDELRMQVEHELGQGDEYNGFEAQRIRYTSYAGLGTTNLDLGGGQSMPDIKAEVMGAYQLYSTADADFADMIEDVLRQGQSQGSVSVTSTAGTTPLQFGVSTWEFPGTIQKKFFTGLAAGSQTIQYDLLVTEGNYLVVVANCGSTGPNLGISDSLGNAWTAVFADNPNTQMWFAKGDATGLDSITITNLNTDNDVMVFEVGGVDTLDATANSNGTIPGGGGNASVNITTTNPPGTVEYIIVSIFPGIGAFQGTLPTGWNYLVGSQSNQGNAYNYGTTNCWTAYKIVTQPATYTFSLPLAPGSSWSLGAVGIKLCQPANYPKPFGDIIDDVSLQMVRDQCRAYGMWGSVCMDSQKKASDWLDDFGIAANLAYVWSGFKLKCLPRAEQSFVGNGAVYVAPTSTGPVANLTTPDFVGDSTKPMIEVVRKGAVDIPSIIQIQHITRLPNQPYPSQVTSQPDQAALAMFGVRKDSPKVLSCIQSEAVARKVANIMIRRQQNTRNTYKFTLNSQSSLLEAWDLVTITDELVGIYQLPVRLTSVKENKDYTLTCEAEDFIYGTHSGVELPITENQQGGGDTGADPGDVNIPIIFKAQQGMNGGMVGTFLGFGLSGLNPFWGGAAIWISLDGTNYTQIGTRTGQTVMGVTTADWPVTANPDTTVDLPVDLSESNGVLPNFSTISEDNFASQIYIEGGAGGSVVITPNIEVQPDLGGSTGCSLGKNWCWEQDPTTPGTATGNSFLVNFPSTDGQSREFDVSWTAFGGEQFHDFFNPLNLDSTSTYFTFDTMVYVTDSTHINNLEFDLNQIISNSATVIYGVRFNFTVGFIQYMSNVGNVPTWTTSNIPCSKFTDNSWHHLVFGYHRDAIGTVTYDYVSIDGVVNTFVSAIVNSGFFLGGTIGTNLVTFQIDGDSTSNSTTAYLDQLDITGSVPSDSCVPYEIGSYAVAALTGTNQFTISATGSNYIRRSAFGTPLVDHPNGSKFALIDSTFTYVAIGPNYINKSVFFKFTSFNTLGGNAQQLADVTAYPFTIPGNCATAFLGAPPAAEIPLTGPAGGGNFTVAHGQSFTPVLVLIQITSSFGGQIWFQSPVRYDATNLYLVGSGTGVVGYALIFKVPPGTEIELAPAAPGNFQVPHSLGVSPALLSIQMTSGGPGGTIWSQEPPSDANFLYLVSGGNNVTGFIEAWAQGPPPAGPINTNFIEIPLAPSLAGNFTIAHGLGVTPLAVCIRMSSGGSIWFQAARYDSTNIYLTASAGGVTGYAEVIYGFVPVLIPPPPPPETITMDKWFNPGSQPYPYLHRLVTSSQKADFWPVPSLLEAVHPDAWIQPQVQPFSYKPLTQRYGIGRIGIHPSEMPFHFWFISTAKEVIHPDAFIQPPSQPYPYRPLTQRFGVGRPGVHPSEMPYLFWFISSAKEVVHADAWAQPQSQPVRKQAGAANQQAAFKNTTSS